MLLINFDFFVECCISKGFSFKLHQKQVLKENNQKNHGRWEAAKWMNSYTLLDQSQNETDTDNHVNKN